jgi:threonine synthase
MLSSSQAVLRGLAPDGGLYIPTDIPTLPADWQSAWSQFSFTDLAFEVLSLFIPASAQEGGIPSDDLRKIINRSFATFRSDDVTPLCQLSEKEWCLELWHGPTFAFKDVALQTLGNLFEYFLARRNADSSSSKERQRLTVLGATSGDTGSAAIAGLRSKPDISIFMLHPKNRVSPIQEAQMTTVLDDNVHNLAMEGTFDDCQDVVKLLFSDAKFNATHHLGAVNSINFARILAQIVYYFSAYFQFVKQTSSSSSSSATKPQLQFVVPTGNFGDVLAGYYAKRLGLPMADLVVATNENDILQRFWKSGRYEKVDSGKAGGTTEEAPQTEPAAGSSDGAQAVGGVKATLSPAMDILVSSNFERLLWYLVYESQDADKKSFADAGQQIKTWMDDLKSKGAFQVSEAQFDLAKRDFTSRRVSDQETKETILKYFTNDSRSYLVDPHTAVGFHAANRTQPTK